MDGGRKLTLVIGRTYAGRTVDSLLRRELGLSGTAVKRAKRMSGAILLDGRPAAVNVRADAGQVLTVLVSDPDPGTIRPAEGPLSIVYEDADLLIADKQAGMAVHPGPGHGDDTLGNIVAGYYKKHGITAAFHPVNRLDRGTSGLMVVAKHAHAQERLISRLHTGQFQRVYLAVCEGRPDPPMGLVDAPIARAAGSAIKRQVCSGGAPARTRYELLETHGGRSLVQLELETGRTHQIRIHMAWLGCPLAGDFLYGREDKALIARPALHSARLALLHPVTGALITVAAPLPHDMTRLLSF